MARFLQNKRDDRRCIKNHSPGFRRFRTSVPFRAIAQDEVFLCPCESRSQNVGRDHRPYLLLKELPEGQLPGTGEQTFAAFLQRPANCFGLGFVREQRHFVSQTHHFVIT